MIPSSTIIAAATLLLMAVDFGEAWTTKLPGDTVSSERGCSLARMVSSTSRSSSLLPDTSMPLSPNTFAGMVEQGLLERFEESEIQRILTSWRLLDQDYEHREYVGDNAEDNRESSNMIQECHSYVPGLAIKAFWNEGDFEWANYLQGKYREILKEFQSAMSDRSKLEQQGNNIWAGALTDDASSYGVGWKTLVLMNRGRWDLVNAQLFPKTSQAIHKSGVPATEIFFASMEGPSSIKMHSDFTNFVLTSHLALDIPYSGENKCRLTVGDETRQWINGNVMVFDTSLLHDAVNESDKMRYILMMRIWHPDLTATERAALQFTYDCLELPGLVSSDPGERFLAEQTAESVRAFPKLDLPRVAGFGDKKPKDKKKKGGKR
jgi:Aspartyl/Asparaginyl beta-hydroxylase